MIVGRYVIDASFASGGTGTVHLGRIQGAGGFSRVVAVKRLHPWFAGNAEFRQMLLDEARFVSRIRHPNVVTTLDVVEADKNIYVFMEYVHGVSLDHLLKRCHDRPMPVGIATGILEAVLAGLHAAHEARGEDGTPLGIVHRDVSPQNILVGADGVVRLIDFGIAKAATRLQVTQVGVVKGKIGYMAPEQLLREPVSRQTDIFASAVVLWEALANRRLIDVHEQDTPTRLVNESESIPPSVYRPEVDEKLDDVVLRALALAPAARFPTAEAMACALRQTGTPAGSAEIAKWLDRTAGDDLEISDERVRLVERAAADSDPAGRGGALDNTDHTAATTTARTRGGRISAWRVAVLAGAALIATSAWVGLRAIARHPAVAAATLPPSGADLPPASASASPFVAPSSVAPSSSAASLPSSSLASPPAAAAGASKARSSNKARCDPPYTVDASGRKHYDPSCF